MDLGKECERVTKYASKAQTGKYTLNMHEAAAICECSADVFSMILLAFRYGFEKGCRKTKRDAKKKVSA